jgi:hypothetical protein
MMFRGRLRRPQLFTPEALSCFHKERVSDFKDSGKMTEQRGELLDQQGAARFIGVLAGGILARALGCGGSLFRFAVAESIEHQFHATGDAQLIEDAE